MVEKQFEEVAHTADIAIRVWGKDLADLFANAASGMTWRLADPGKVGRDVARKIELDAYDVETLLVSWLEELLYLAEEAHYVFVAFDMHQVTRTHLRAVARGGVVEQLRGSIKAVTFNDLAVVRTKIGYETTIVFDV